MTHVNLPIGKPNNAQLLYVPGPTSINMKYPPPTIAVHGPLLDSTMSGVPVPIIMTWISSESIRFDNLFNCGPLYLLCLFCCLTFFATFVTAVSIK